MMCKTNRDSVRIFIVIAACFSFVSLLVTCDSGDSDTDVEIDDSTADSIQAIDNAIIQFDQDVKDAQSDSSKAAKLEELYDDIETRFTDDDVSTFIAEWEKLNQAWENGTSFTVSSEFESLISKLSDLEYFDSLSGGGSYNEGSYDLQACINVYRAEIVISNIGYPDCDENCLGYFFLAAAGDLGLAGILDCIPYVGSGVSLFLSSAEVGDLLAHCFPPPDEECTWDSFIQALISWGVDAGSLTADLAGIGAIKSMFKVMALIKTIGSVTADGYRYLEDCNEHMQEECSGDDNGDGDDDEFTEDPFEDYDCTGTGSSDACTEIVCTIKETVYDPLKEACERNWTEQCDRLVRCIKGYISCIHTWDCDAQYMQTCTDDYTNCIDGM